mmetsp:Transcript_41130/g.75147  ORF Transcript_41130/g.75147 Transcript_41130/m.75147 type:complete len:101 (+) Transcript_41130:60-362(+)
MIVFLLPVAFFMGMLVTVMATVGACRHFCTTRDGEGSVNKLLALIFAFFVPPLGIYWRFGISKSMVICILLTMLGYIPGIFFALSLVLFRKTDGEKGKLS